MGRKPCCDKEGVNRGTWSVMEDQILANFIKLHGEGKWRDVPKRAGLNRCGKSCRLRWLNYLRPDIKRGNFSGDEEDLIIRLHNLLGNRWSLIAGRLPGRTDNEIKNFWNTNLSKRVHQLNHPPNNKTSHPITTNKTPTTTSTPPPTLTSAHAQHPKLSSFNVSSPADSSSQLNPAVVRAKPTRCTKTIIFPQSNEWETQNNTAASAQDLLDGCFSSSYGFLEDFDVDGLLIPEEPQAPHENIDHQHDHDDYESHEFESSDDCEILGDNNVGAEVGVVVDDSIGDEANLTHQNLMLGQFLESAHDDGDVDLSFLNLQISDPFMDLDPSYYSNNIIK